MPAFTTDWFTARLPNWERWVLPLAGKPNLTFLEIGSFEGRSALWMLDHVLTGPGCRLICVDLFLPRYEARFDANLAAYRERVLKFKGPSQPILRAMSGAVDLVYVDGDHSAAGVLSDSVLAWPLLKLGGLMIWDDYASAKVVHVKPAADAFVAAYRGQLQPLFAAHDQLGVRKTAATAAAACAAATLSPIPAPRP